MSLQGSVKPGYIITGRVTELDYILMTAYGIALKNGFKGTELEWLDSLDGTKVPESTLTTLIAKYFIDHPIEDGIPGHDGTTFYPSVDEDGNLSWTNDGAKENPEPVNIKGDTGTAGADGAAGADGKDGADGYTPVKGVDYYTEEDKEGLAKQVLEIVPTPTDIDLSNFSNGTWTETIDGEVINHTSVFSEDGTTVTIDGVTVKLG